MKQLPTATMWTSTVYLTFKGVLASQHKGNNGICLVCGRFIRKVPFGRQWKHDIIQYYLDVLHLLSFGAISPIDKSPAAHPTASVIEHGLLIIANMDEPS